MTHISTLPTPPSRTDAPATFSSRADALLGALPTFVAEANALSDEVDAMRDDAEAKRAATEDLRDETAGLVTQGEGIKDDTQYLHDQTVVLKADAQAAASTAQAVAAAYGNEVGLPSLTGHARHALAVNEAGNGVEWVQFIQPDSLVILTSGTSWVAPDGVRLARIRGVGGCGGGGNGEGYSWGSGAAGGEFEAIVTLTPGATYTYAIGAGGAGSAIVNSGGAYGGTTSITIGTLTFAAYGGSGGTGAGNSAGGSASAPAGLAKKGQPGHISVTGGVTRGGVSSLGTQGGYGGQHSAGPGDAGKIVLEIYK